PEFRPVAKLPPPALPAFRLPVVEPPPLVINAPQTVADAPARLAPAAIPPSAIRREVFAGAAPAPKTNPPAPALQVQTGGFSNVSASSVQSSRTVQVAAA